MGGRLDAGYRGELLVLLINLNMPEYDLIRSHDQLSYELHRRGGEPVEIKAGDKIIQITPVRPIAAEIKEVGGFAESARGEKGFGSSGR